MKECVNSFELCNRTNCKIIRITAVICVIPHPFLGINLRTMMLTFFFKEHRLFCSMVLHNKLNCIGSVTLH